MWGGGPRGFRGCSVKIVDIWTNSGFVDMGGGGPGGWGGGPRGFCGCSVKIVDIWTNSGFVDMVGGARGVGRGSAGVPWMFRKK